MAKTGFYFAARRNSLERTELIELVHLKTGYIQSFPEVELNSIGIELGDFVKILDVQGRMMFLKTEHHCSGIFTTTEGDIAYIENVGCKFERVEGKLVLTNNLFPIALCGQNGLKEHSNCRVRYSLLPKKYIECLRSGKKIVFEGTLYPNRHDSPPKCPTHLNSPKALPRIPSPTSTEYSLTHLPQPINKQVTGTPLEPSKEQPVLDTDSPVKFWAAQRTHNNHEDITLLDCVLLGKSQLFRIKEEKMKGHNIELGGFFRASILDGEVCEFEKDDPPAGWIVKPYKTNLAAITEVISDVIKINGKCVLRNPILGLLFCDENISEGQYTHEVIMSKEPIKIGDKTLILEAKNLTKVHQHFKAVVLSYTEKDHIRTHDVLIIGKNIKCQFTDKKTKLQKFDFFMGEFEEINGTWICVKYGKEVKTEIELCTEHKGKYMLQVNSY